MKHWTLAVASLLCACGALPAAAQSHAVDRGSLMLGGTAGFTSSGSSVNGESLDDRVTQISLAPQLLYFIVPGLAIGGEVLFSRISSDGDALTSYGFGPAATYYFGREERTAYPHIGGSMQFAWTSDDSTDADQPSLMGFRGAAGVLFMLSDAVGLNTELFYQLLERESDLFDVDIDTYGLAIGFSAFIF
jgi:hypothetical protein